MRIWQVILVVGLVVSALLSQVKYHYSELEYQLIHIDWSISLLAFGVIAALERIGDKLERLQVKRK